ncbi:MAG: hypothetical protein KDI14_07200 [Halioglobus sp.]|nr:hypothetical protein [Halioglobus sp.]
MSGHQYPGLNLAKSNERTMRQITANTGELQAPLKGVFAIVGCDGTGKTVLTRDLKINLGRGNRTVRRYLGLVSGETGDKIKSLPFIGVRLEDNLHKKANRALDMDKKLPGTGTALIMYLFSLWRVAQLLRVRRLSRRGVQVITDRYPQAQIPGFHYDGPGLTVGRTSNWLVRKLAVGEQRMYEWMATQRPSLVIRLSIDADTAHSRKLDHDLAELRDKIAVMRRLDFNGATVCEIDAATPYENVLGSALAAIKKASQPPP